MSEASKDEKDAAVVSEACPVALVTGGNRGIGKEVVRQLVARGFRVFLGARDEAKGHRAAEEIGSDSGRLDVIELDVASAASIQSAVRALKRRTDRLDVLVNNAGIYPDGSGGILEVEEATVLEAFQTNAVGALLLAQAVFPLLEAAPDGGRLVQVSSGLGQLAEMEDETPSYAISKTTLNAITRQLAGAGRHRGVAVNSVCPGWVQTDMGGAGAPRSVEQGADTIVWLANEAPSSLTGQFLRDRLPIVW